MQTKWPKKERSSFEGQLDQPSILSTPVGVALEEATRPDLVIQNEAKSAYLDQLAFNEDWVKIRVQRGTEKFAALTVPCQIAGFGAEVLVDGRVLQLAEVPVETDLVMKRKYVEVLARSRTMMVSAYHDNPRHVEIPQNHVRKSFVPTHNILLLETNPSARVLEWWARITHTQA